jgi:quercetin dioxygenase-like cupin family protein
MPPQIEPSPRPDWSPLPGDGVVGVMGKVLVREWGFFIAMLRFEPDATIHEHPGPNDTVVICIDGEGWTSVAGERARLRAGETVRWPKDVPHRLWTEGTTMTTLMFEREAGAAEAAPA